MSIEEMKQVLNALKKCHYYMINAGLPNQSLLNEAFTVITALRQAIEQAEQQDWAKSGSGLWTEVPLYTSPPQHKWVGLTNEDFVELCDTDLGTAALIRRVEDKLKEKNT